MVGLTGGLDLGCETKKRQAGAQVFHLSNWKGGIGVRRAWRGAKQVWEFEFGRMMSRSLGKYTNLEF